MDGGRWQCAWHDWVEQEGIKPTRENFEAFLSRQKEMGTTRWNHRLSGEWWELAQGIVRPGGFDWASRENLTVVDASKRRAGIPIFNKSEVEEG